MGSKRVVLYVNDKYVRITNTYKVCLVKDLERASLFTNKQALKSWMSIIKKQIKMNEFEVKNVILKPIIV